MTPNLQGAFGQTGGLPTSLDLPALPPNWPKASETKMTDLALALLTQPWDPFNRAQHEATMNAWLIRYVAMDNARKLQTYMHAWTDYKLNAQRFVDMGLAVPPFTVPAPILTDIGPMPDGYWFGVHA